MRLKQYLDENGIKYLGFAKKIGCTYQDIYLIINRGCKSLELALKIEKATNGQVKCKDLLEAERTPKKKSEKVDKDLEK